LERKKKKRRGEKKKETARVWRSTIIPNTSLRPRRKRAPGKKEPTGHSSGDPFGTAKKEEKKKKKGKEKEKKRATRFLDPEGKRKKKVKKKKKGEGRLSEGYLLSLNLSVGLF